MQITVTSYREINKNKLLGVCNIEMMIDGHPFTVNKVKVIENNKGGTFYGMPSEKYEDKEGQEQYANHCGFFSKDGYADFSQSMKAALEKYTLKNKNKVPPSEGMPF